MAREEAEEGAMVACRAARGEAAETIGVVADRARGRSVATVALVPADPVAPTRRRRAARSVAVAEARPSGARRAPARTADPGARGRDLEITDVLDRVLMNHEFRGHTAATQRGYSDIVNLFARYLAAHGHPTTIGAITAEHVEEWAADVRARGRSARTIRSYVSSVKAFSRRAVELNYVEADPLAQVWTPRAPVLAKPSLSAEEIERIAASCDRRSVTGRRDLALVLLLSGGCAPRRPSAAASVAYPSGPPSPRWA